MDKKLECILKKSIDVVMENNMYAEFIEYGLTNWGHPIPGFIYKNIEHLQPNDYDIEQLYIKNTEGNIGASLDEAILGIESPAMCDLYEEYGQVDFMKNVLKMEDTSIIDRQTEKKYFDYIDSIMLKLKELYKSDEIQRYIGDILDRKYN
ncbi:hypothetical protein [Clostridium sp.]|uniref:hypothetical protein n=1 Tax=Clostridium sp. TaxID=1506 RepID=UPI003F2D85A3